MTYDFTATALFAPILLTRPNTFDQTLDILGLSAPGAASLFWGIEYVTASWFLLAKAEGLGFVNESTANTGRGLNKPMINKDNFQFTRICH